MEFVEIGQGYCLQRRPECTVGDGVFGTRLEVNGLRRKVSGDGVSGGQDRRMAGRTMEAVGVTIGERFGSVVVKSEMVNCGFPMTGDARLSIRHHTWLTDTALGVVG